MSWNWSGQPLQQESSSPHFPAQASPARHPAILLLTYISPLQRWGSAKRSRFLIDALKQHGVVDVLVLSFVDIADARPTLTVTEMDGRRAARIMMRRTDDPGDTPPVDAGDEPAAPPAE